MTFEHKLIPSKSINCLCWPLVIGSLKTQVKIPGETGPWCVFWVQLLSLSCVGILGSGRLTADGFRCVNLDQVKLRHCSRKSVCSPISPLYLHHSCYTAFPSLCLWLSVVQCKMLIWYIWMHLSMGWVPVIQQRYFQYFSPVKILRKSLIWYDVKKIFFILL